MFVIILLVEMLRIVALSSPSHILKVLLYIIHPLATLAPKPHIKQLKFASVCCAIVWTLGGNWPLRAYRAFLSFYAPTAVKDNRAVCFLKALAPSFVRGCSLWGKECSCNKNSQPTLTGLPLLYQTGRRTPEHPNTCFLKRSADV